MVALTISSKNAPDLSKYLVVLQARNNNKNEAHEFYSNVGFQDAQFIDQLSKLQEVFAGLPKLVERGEQSFNDLIHYMWNATV